MSVDIVKEVCQWHHGQVTSLPRLAQQKSSKIASLRGDGTLRKPRTIWVVRVGDDLYVRSVYGRTSGWFRGVQTCHQGRIQAGGVEKDVTFVEEADPDINAQIDAAYRTKYRSYAASIVNTTVSPEARSADPQTRAVTHK